jgi:hypothetical protein
LFHFSALYFRRAFDQHRRQGRPLREDVRCRTDVAMTSEVLCKRVAHNICCLIMSQVELGIEPVFDVPAEAPKPVAVAADDFDPRDFRFSD